MNQLPAVLKPLECSEYKKTYKRERRNDLTSHGKRLHQEKLELIAPLKKDNSSTVLTARECIECREIFEGYDNLRKHVKECHLKKLGLTKTGDNFSSNISGYENLREHIEQSEQEESELIAEDNLTTDLKMNECSECKKSYKSYKDLRRHVKQSHQEKLEIIAPLKKKANLSTNLKMNECSECKKKYKEYKDLRRHVKRFHREKLESIAPLKRNNNLSPVLTAHECSECKKKYKRYKDLKRHAEEFHQEKYNLSGVLKQHECSECKKTYRTYKNLRKHVRLSHLEKLELIAPLKKKDYQFNCTYCNKNFSSQNNFKYHLRKVHGSGIQSDLVSRKKCALCDYLGPSKKKLNEHYTRIHSITIESETINFLTTDEFIIWKEKLERESKSRFVKESGGPKSKIAYYKCHRSGFYKSESKGKRRIKSQGSNKINGLCPATITLVSEKNESCKVHFTKTHVGHQNDLGRLTLTSSERQLLATKLASKIPLDMIMEEVRESISTSSSLERIHLLTKKDLYNIKANFNLQSTTVRHQNDAISIDTLVKQIDGKFVSHSTENFEIVWDNSGVEGEIILENEKSLDEKKEEMLSSLTADIRSIQTEAQFKAVEKLIRPLKSILAAAEQVEENEVSIKTLFSSCKPTVCNRL